MKEVFVHPQLGNVTLYRSRAVRRVSVSVRPSGEIRLNVPVRYPMRKAVEFLNQKQLWVKDALDLIARKYNPQRCIKPPFSTYSHSLEFVYAKESADRIRCVITGSALRIVLPEGSNPESEDIQNFVKAAVVRTLRLEAQAVLPDMTAQVATQYGFKYRKVSVRASKSRWGSCSANDNISLSIYLMMLPEHLIRYVILHELCHTRHKDHSAAFHALLDSLSGGREAQLRRELLAYNFFWL